MVHIAQPLKILFLWRIGNGFPKPFPITYEIRRWHKIAGQFRTEKRGPYL
jgi:hypothetical protein